MGWVIGGKGGEVEVSKGDIRVSYLEGQGCV